jgi:hypothetical protein
MKGGVGMGQVENEEMKRVIQMGDPKCSGKMKK